jgi:MinD superfamily P-loop ATPase
MKQLTVVSGKGGTGKTTITASFVVLAKHTIVADCDVDAPDLHMLLHPEIIKSQEFKGSKIALIDESRCTQCGLCRQKCAFDAITPDFKVDHIACEGCGVCRMLCPVSAITMTDRTSGYAYISKTKYGFMTHAKLNPGEANSGKLVTLVRQNASMLAKKKNSSLIIIDGSPGVGCPVIASISGVDAGLAVTEPTVSGIHDLERVLRLMKHFKVCPLVCINMYDINKDNTAKIEDFCRKNGIDVVGKIPFNQIVTEAMVCGRTVVEYSPRSEISKEIKNAWDIVRHSLRLDRD